MAKVLPLAGLQLTLVTEQLSDVVVTKLTGAPVSDVALAILSAGHTIVGDWVSLTVTVNEQEIAPPAPAAHMTGVLPSGKNEPACGLHVTGPQGPLVVGSG
jgi:hypothetical protein